MPKNESIPRVAPQFAVLRTAIIHVLASAKTPMATQDIANKLGVNRSYVIRLQEMSMKPRTPAERKIAKLAAENESALKKLGFGYFFNGDIETTLAGGDRMSLPRESRGGRPRKDAAPAKPAPKKAKPKAEKKAKPAPKKAAPAPKKAEKKVSPPQPKEGSKMARAAKKGPPAAQAPKERKPKPAKTKASAQPPLPLTDVVEHPDAPKADAAASLVDAMLRSGAEAKDAA